MNIALAENVNHHHTFKLRYKFDAGQRMLIDPVCKCTDCAVKAHIKVAGDHVSLTLVSGEEQMSYSVALFGEVQP